MFLDWLDDQDEENPLKVASLPSVPLSKASCFKRPSPPPNNVGGVNIIDQSTHQSLIASVGENDCLDTTAQG